MRNDVNECRQKAGRSPLQVGDHIPEETSVCFQVIVNVLEARKLKWKNPRAATSYVILSIGKEKFRTTIRRNMLEPYYRESFTFNLYTSVREVQRTTLWMGVMEPRCCAPPRAIGEVNIDLGTIWALPNHQAFHKWAQLDQPSDLSAGVVGFLKIDISITVRGDIQALSCLISEENLEDNLLLPSGSEQQHANYVISIYDGFGLPTNNGDRRHAKPPSTYVSVTFCGVTAKTAVQSRTHSPSYNERISIVEMFPNMSQTIRFEVYSAESSRVIASASLNLRLVSHDGEKGFLPTFGPLLLPMYGYLSTDRAVANDGPFYHGSLMVSVEVTVPYYEHPLKSKYVEPLTPIKLESLWPVEEFCVICPVFEVSMLDRRITGNHCGVAITIGDFSKFSSGEQDFDILREAIRSRKLHYTGALDVVKTSPIYGHLDFPNAFPVLQLATRLPDFRLKMYINNFIQDIIAELDTSISKIENRYSERRFNNPRELIVEITNIREKLIWRLKKYTDAIKENSREFKTELDQKVFELQMDAIENLNIKMSKTILYDSISSITKTKGNPIMQVNVLCSKKEYKALLAESKSISEYLKSLIYKIPEPWPDIVIWLLSSGSRVGYNKISSADIIHSADAEKRGQKCGCIHTVYFKPLKCPHHRNATPETCSCIVGKVELVMWMGLYKQMNSFNEYLPEGYKVKVKNHDMCIKVSSMMVECRSFIYQAKFVCADHSKLGYTFARINILNSTKETNVKEKSASPIWNQVLRVYKMVLMNLQRLICTPPKLLVEIYETDLSGNFELLGRSEITPVVDERQDYQYAPKLEWYTIYKGTECTGQILMSVQLIQVPETVMKTTVYGSTDATYCVTGIQDLDQDCEKLESLPPQLVPKWNSYKVDLYWWGLRNTTITRKPCLVFEMENIIIKSNIIVNKKSNCNFPNGRVSHVFEGTLTEEFLPAMCFKLYDTSTFGRTLYLGTHIVKNPRKFIVNWISQDDRDISLRSASFASANLFQVNSTLITGNQSNYVTDFKRSKSNKSKNITVQTAIRNPRWKRILCYKETDEEEHSLLPIYDKHEQDNVETENITNNGASDWWTRFLKSQKENFVQGDKNDEGEIKIYAMELEKVPEFSKFKDWCSTFKLYNGKKTGIVEKDDQIFCGYLKAGVAMYKWPPSETTIAVSETGVDLSRGYFSNYPPNDATKFLIRVYLISAADLTARNFGDQPSSYAVITCGNKEYGDRDNDVPSITNPIFGKMYELRCTLPEDYLLTVSIYSKDATLSDDLIGSTSIDLEDRIYSKHRGCVGLASEYSQIGSTKWRDSKKPSSILEELCRQNHIAPPFFLGASTLFIEYKENCKYAFSSSSTIDRKENICLNVLHKWHTLPVIGHHLVPEHVETRTLYNPKKPGLEQGKIQMWIDIYSMEYGVYIPQPVNIEPRKIEDYELRVVVRQVKFFRSKDQKFRIPNNLQVRCWVGDINQTQSTEVQSSNGDFHFNRRMIFTIHYHPSLAKLVNKAKDPFIGSEEYIKPMFEIRILDDEFEHEENEIGGISLNLLRMPQGALSAQSYNENLERSRMFSIFSTKNMRGWWPLTLNGQSSRFGTKVGMINMELSIMPLEKSVVMTVMNQSASQPLSHDPDSDSNVLSNIESFLRHGGVEYAVVGIIVVITLILAVHYFDLTKDFHIFFFD